MGLSRDDDNQKKDTDRLHEGSETYERWNLRSLFLKVFMVEVSIYKGVSVVRFAYYASSTVLHHAS
jgi:hypothetical protein